VPVGNAAPPLPPPQEARVIAVTLTIMLPIKSLGNNFFKTRLGYSISFFWASKTNLKFASI
jgi:hypothetical protein